MKPISDTTKIKQQAYTTIKMLMTGQNILATTKQTCNNKSSPLAHVVRPRSHDFSFFRLRLVYLLNYQLHVSLLFLSQQYFKSVASKTETNLIHVVDGVRWNIHHVWPWNFSLLVQHFNRHQVS
jgi:hypothetical protein